jgi:putative nucleotidyltransferase with HDIG domain
VAILDWAEEAARVHLEAALPRRWVHVQEVARRAGRLAARLEADGELLNAAAWLHDVGYAPDLAVTKFHPLDGARYLRRVGAPERVVGLVAFHSSAEAEAEHLGLAAEMREFHDERTLVRDLLWYTDMTIGPSGERMTFERRMAEVRERYPDDHYVVRALDAGMEERRQAVARAEQWIEQVGLTGQV